MVRAHFAARDRSSPRQLVHRPHGFAIVHERRQLDSALEGHADPSGAARAGRGRRIAKVLVGLLAAVIAAPAQVSSNVALSNGVQLTIDARAADGSAVVLKASLEPAS